jgi:hypothetical protein
MQQHRHDMLVARNEHFPNGDRPPLRVWPTGLSISPTAIFDRREDRKGRPRASATLIEIQR